MAVHKHKCPNDSCAHVWSHDPDDLKGSCAFTQAHACPKCGAEQWDKHYESPKERILEALEDLFGGQF